jgi:hypothetical protein
MSEHRTPEELRRHGLDSEPFPVVSDTQARLDALTAERHAEIAAEHEARGAGTPSWAQARADVLAAELEQANENRMFASQMIADYREAKECAEAELERVTAALRWALGRVAMPGCRCSTGGDGPCTCDRESWPEYQELRKAQALAGGARAAQEFPPDCTDGQCKRCRPCYSEYVAAKMNGELDDDARAAQEPPHPDETDDVPHPAAHEDTLPCGHPLSAVVSADEGTSYCGGCAQENERSES